MRARASKRAFVGLREIVRRRRRRRRRRWILIPRFCICSVWCALWACFARAYTQHVTIERRNISRFFFIFVVLFSLSLVSYTYISGVSFIIWWNTEGCKWCWCAKSQWRAYSDAKLGGGALRSRASVYICAVHFTCAAKHPRRQKRTYVYRRASFAEDVTA